MFKKLNISNYFFFSILILICQIIFLFLIFKSYKLTGDGAEWFGYAKGLVYYNKLINVNYWPIQEGSRTFQLGIVYFFYISYYLLEDFWFIIYFLSCFFLWVFAYKEIAFFLEKYNEKKYALLISLSIYFQIDNINNLIGLNGESLYYPALIIFVLNYTRTNKINAFGYFFLLLGLIFRIQHITVFVLILFNEILKKELKYKTIFLITFSIFLFFLHRELVLSPENYNWEKSLLNNYSILPSLLAINDFLFNASHYLYLARFFGYHSGIATIIALLNFLFLFYILIHYIKKQNLAIINLIFFVVINSCFLYLLRGDLETERFYVLSSFCVNIIFFLFIKKFFKDLVFKRIIFSLLVILCSITILFLYNFFQKKDVNIHYSYPSKSFNYQVSRSLNFFKNNYDYENYIIISYSGIRDAIAFYLKSPVCNKSLQDCRNKWSSDKFILKKFNNQKNCITRLSKIIQANKLDDIEKSIFDAIECDFDRVIFQNYFPYKDSEAELVLFENNNTLKKIKKKFKRYKKQIKIIWPNVLNSKEGFNCNNISVNTTIDSKGNLALCCFLTPPKESNGNIFNHSSNPWNSSEFIRFRSHYAKKSPSECSNCYFKNGIKNRVF